MMLLRFSSLVVATLGCFIGLSEGSSFMVEAGGKPEDDAFKAAAAQGVQRLDNNIAKSRPAAPRNARNKGRKTRTLAQGLTPDNELPKEPASPAMMSNPKTPPATPPKPRTPPATLPKPNAPYAPDVEMRRSPPQGYQAPRPKGMIDDSPLPYQQSPQLSPRPEAKRPPQTPPKPASRGPPQTPPKPAYQGPPQLPPRPFENSAQGPPSLPPKPSDGSPWKPPVGGKAPPKDLLGELRKKQQEKAARGGV